MTMRRLLGGMLVVLLVSGVAGAQPPDARGVADLRVKANAGNAKAQNSLGYAYYHGWGVPQDYTQAAAWWRKAAEQGIADAQDRLAYAYRYGRGVPQDYVEAHKWINLAASRASADYQELYADDRDAVAALMTPAQLAEAQKLASAWLAAFQKRGGQ